MTTLHHHPLQKIVLLFFHHPMAQYGIRELSKLTSTDTKTIMKYLDTLVQKRIICRKEQRGKFPYYEANRTSYIYHHEKSEQIIKKIYESGVIEYLEQQLTPKVIILFGSIRKGTYHSKSDVDIFIQAPSKKINLTKFSKKIGYPIELFCEPDLKNLSKGLLTNIYNGLILAGKLEIPP